MSKTQTKKRFSSKGDFKPYCFYFSSKFPFAVNHLMIRYYTFGVPLGMLVHLSSFDLEDPDWLCNCVFITYQCISV